MASGEALGFLSAVTAACPDDQWGYLWTLSADGENKESHWFQISDVERAADLATSLGDSTNVYFGVSTSQRGRGPKRRNTNESASGIYALVADVDISDPDTHKKLNYPGSEEEALSVMEMGGLSPTVVVHSGNGLHAWWVFGDFWEFHDDSERLAAATLAQRWHATLRVRAAEQGWRIDSVFDLARVLRVPGTFNHKTTPPNPVRLLSCEPGRTYDPRDFDEFLVEESEMRRLQLPVTRTYQVDSIRLDPEARPPAMKVEALRLIEERFGAAMDRNRPDLKDQSPSSFDLSLATYAAQASWDDQEIVDLLIHCRALHGENLKLDNAQYYRRTVAKAHEAVGQERAREQIAEHVEEMIEAAQSDDEEEVSDARRKLFDMVSSLIGLEVTSMVRYTSDPPEFGIVIGGHMVHLGQIDHMEGQAKFRSRVLASDVGQATPRLKTPEWDQIVQALRHACHDQDVGTESTETGAMAVWINEYLLDRQPISDAMEAAAAQYPFVDQLGRTCIFPKPFIRWVFTTRGERVSTKTMGRILAQMGASTTEVALNGSSATSRQVWVLPTSMRQDRAQRTS